MELNDLMLPVALVPIVIGLVQVCKIAGLPSRVAPMLSILLGVGASFLLPLDGNLGVIILEGIMVGLSASGLYSGAKATITPEERI